ncbi:caspase-1-like isoform X1 [Rhincodon typus]|uniref:caspase-1-like isoform X1 n=1 Tax=Rhincodon typus TaxID=259920 RepID=UPI00202E6149|nr:caspase-1-like isoform X1 [Rhincodon typus]
MEAADQRLKHLRTDLVNGLTKGVIDDLVDEMQEARVINTSESEEILQAQATTKNKARCLIDTVSKKGPRASEKFIDSLNKADKELCVKLSLCLVKTDASSSDPKQTSETSAGIGSVVPTTSTLATAELPTSDEWITPCTQQHYEEISQKTNEVYQILPKQGRKRLAILINNIDFEKPEMKRKGAEVDEEQMQKLLNGFGYQVEKHNNLTGEEMKQALAAFSNREEHSQSDSTFVVLMSHGLRDKICGRFHNEAKEDTLHIDNVFNILDNKSCKGLRGKPKIIIVQACRGSNLGYAYVSDSANDEPVADYEEEGPFYKIHKESDFICFCSTTPDNVSLRHVQNGSIFIQSLVDLMRRNASKYDVEEIFFQVQQSFHNFARQLPVKERGTLMKKFYLFPGI